MKACATCALAVLLTAAAVARVASGWLTFNETYDAPAHIAAGMEWIQYGSYTYDLHHPPLARIAVAIGPYLNGARLPVKRDAAKESPNFYFADGSTILYDDMMRWRNLVFARAGILPFLILACAVTYLWAARWFGRTAAVWAVGLLTLTPPFLGHSGMASTDLACAATVMLALYCFVRWLESPGWRSAVPFGISIALALLSKYSSIPFLTACFAGTALVLALRKKKLFEHKLDLIWIALSFFMVTWAGFRFTVVPLAEQWTAHPRIDHLLEPMPLVHAAWERLLRIPVPLTELFLGIRNVLRHNAIGHESFLLGEYRTDGWWYFFPVALAVKTPVGLLVLGILGIGGAAWRFRGAAWQKVLTALFPLAILASVLPVNINSGIRHILAIYPLLAILAAWAVTRLLSSSRWTGAVALLFAGWVTVDSIRAHPDNMAYFNELAGENPENILCESDLDFGQDLQRLTERLKELGAREVSIAYFGTAPLDKAGLPEYRILGEQQPKPGYIAVSVRYLTMEFAKNGGYAWLKRYMPVERVGKSIDLFYLDKLP